MTECWIRELNRRYRLDVSFEDLKEYDIQKCFPELTAKQIYLPYVDGTLYTDIAPVSQAQKLISSLSENHDIYVATANVLGMDTNTLYDIYYEGYNARALQYMLDFLWRYYPSIPQDHIIVTKYKKFIKADCLIDDNPVYLREGSYKRILIDKPYNRDIDDPYFRIYRAKSWKDVEKYIQEGCV